MDEKSVKLEISNSNFVKKCEELTSEIVNIQNLPWKMKISRFSGLKLIVKLICNENSASNLWSCVAKIDFIGKIQKNSGDVQIQKTSASETLNYAKNHVEIELDVQDFSKLEIEAKIQLSKISGIRKRKIIDYSRDQPILFNGILSIEGRKVHVNKQLLTMHSKYFENLFFGNFTEKNLEIVEIPDVKYSEFCEFLDIIHPTSAEIQKSTVESLLELADRFQTDEVSSRCEKFLISTEEVPVARKLILAQKYRLGELMDFCLKMFNSPEDMLPLRASEFYKDFNENVKSTLLERLIKVDEF